MAAAFVQSKGNTGTDVSSRTALFASAVEIGQIIWACAGWSGDDVSTMTMAVTDDAGNTYTANTLRTKTGTGANKVRVQSFYVVNAFAGAHTLTFTLTGGPVAQLAVNALVLSGVETSSPLIQENWGQGTVSSVNAGDLVTDADGAILVSMLKTSNARTFSKPTSYTTTTNEDGTSAVCGYRAVGAADTYSAVWNWTGGDSNGVAVHDAFRATIVAAPTSGVLTTLRTRGVNHRIN